MKKNHLKRMGVMLIISLLVAGCGAAKSEPAPAKDEEQTQATEVPASEETQEAETPVAEEPAAEETAQAEGTEEASPLYVKVSEIYYYILENGEKAPIVETKYEYDDHSNVILATIKDIHPDSLYGIFVSAGEITYDYEYDENGNKMKSVERSNFDDDQNNYVLTLKP